jgi:two-component sensor histidine kinase
VDARVPVGPMILVAVFIGVFGLFTPGTAGRPLPSGAPTPLYGAIVDGLLFAALITSMLYTAMRVSNRGDTLKAHWIAALALGMAYPAARFSFVAIVGHPYSLIRPGRLLTIVLVCLVLYGLVLLLLRGVEYARLYRGSEAVALRLRSDVAEAGRRRAEAQLRALKMELNPHFLGNALAAVSSLVRTDPAAADRVITELVGVTHVALSHIETQEVTLGEEIAGLAPFLAVERARFGDRLDVTMNIPSAIRDARVPHLILQPLVENAVKHGLSPRGAGHILVAAVRAGDTLELSVQDDGVGLQPSPRRSSPPHRTGGVGLTNIRARLLELYGSRATLDLVAHSEAGTVARLRIPYVVA